MNADEPVSVSKPAQLLFGRSAELAAARAHLTGGERLLVLRGPPGVGKSTLARALGSAVESDGWQVHFVALEGSATRAELLGVVAAALGVPARTDDARVLLDRLASHLEGERTLLVVDGVEEQAAAVRELILDLLGVTSDLSVVACSRRPLGASLEVVVSLVPLAMNDAVALLTRRVWQLAPDRPIATADAERLAARAGRLPLALELVAAWVATLGTREALGAIDEGHLEVDALDRALDASWNLLPEEERSALALLGVFRRTFTMKAARSVVDHPRSAANVAALAAASLLDPAPDGEGAGHSRFAMLEGVRTYALRRAEVAGLLPLARERHCRHFAHEPRPRADHPSSWIRLTLERDDLLAAWEWAASHEPLLAMRLAIVLDPILVTRGPVTLHRTLLERTVAVCAQHGVSGPEHAPQLVDLHLSLGRIATLRGKHRAALAPFRTALALAEGSKDEVRVGWMSAFLCYSLRALGDFEAAQALGDRGLALAHSHHDARLMAMAEQVLGSLRLAQGDLDGAVGAYRRSAAAARRASARRLEGIALANRARAHQEQGDLEGADAFFAESRAVFADISDEFHLARLRAHEGSLLVQRGQLPEAEATLARALDEVSAQDDVEGELEARTSLVQSALNRGDLRLAERRLDELDAAMRSTDDASWGGRTAALRAALAPGPRRARSTVELSRDGRWLGVAARTFDLTRRGPLRRVLVALAELRERSPTQALSVADLQAAGWPGEKMHRDSGAARVYMAVRRLRMLGLESALRTSDAGYAFDESVEIVWRDGPPQVLGAVR